MDPFIVGITGASGVVYGLRLVSILAEKKIKTHLIITLNGLKVIRNELDLDLGNELPINQSHLIKLFGEDSPKYVLPEGIDDWESSLASGSYKSGPMVVIPCSMATLSAIANGSSRNLLERRADIMLKEKRHLILVPRETPFNQIHISHMLSLCQMGADIVPAMPAFYHNPQTLSDIVDFVVGKVLDLLNISHTLYKRWKS